MLTKPPATIPNVASGNPMDVSRLTKKAVTDVFEMIGGIDRLAEEADKDAKWFYEKLWGKTMQPEKIEVHREMSIADMLAQLDAEVVNVTPIPRKPEERVRGDEEED